MNAALKYQVEPVGLQKVSQNRQYAILNTGASFWSGDFGACDIRRLNTTEASYRSWKLRTNCPVVIISEQIISGPLLIYARQGACSLQSPEGKSVPIPSTTYILQPSAGQGLRLRIPSAGEYEWMTIQFGESADVDPSAAISPTLFVAGILERMFEELASPDPSPERLDAYRNAIVNLTDQQRLEQVPSGAAVVPREQQMIEEIMDTILGDMEQKIPTAEHSRKYYMHPAKLRHLFKEEIGRTPAAFQREAKLEKARQLLADPSLKIQDIALQVGFSNPCYFAKFFKIKTGFSPSKFRRLDHMSNAARNPE